MTYRNGDYRLIQLLHNLISIMAFIWNLNLLFSKKSLYNLALKSIFNMHAHCRKQRKEKAGVKITNTTAAVNVSILRETTQNLSRKQM